MYPTQIKLNNKKDIFIKWDDGTESRIGLEKLRKNCPCATCITEKEKQSISYIPILHENQVKILNLNQVGSYAISIIWKDGHNTGIYEYPYLKTLAQK
ncbi:MAG: DUF971 domain-containing protein [Ignavibacteriaceae bacterium]